MNGIAVPLAVLDDRLAPSIDHVVEVLHGGDGEVLARPPRSARSTRCSGRRAGSGRPAASCAIAANCSSAGTAGSMRWSCHRSMQSTPSVTRLPSTAARNASGRPSVFQLETARAAGTRPSSRRRARDTGVAAPRARAARRISGPYELAVSTRFTPSSGTSRSVSRAAATSRGGPITHLRRCGIVPKPSRETWKSPIAIRPTRHGEPPRAPTSLLSARIETRSGPSPVRVIARR